MGKKQSEFCRFILAILHAVNCWHNRKCSDSVTQHHKAPGPAGQKNETLPYEPPLAFTSTSSTTLLLWIKLQHSWTRLAALQDLLGKCPLKDRGPPPSTCGTSGHKGWATEHRRTQTQANARSTENRHFQPKTLWFLGDCRLNNKAWNLKFNLRLSQLSMSRFVHSPHSKWTSLCFGRPKTLGGRHWPGAMLSVRAGRLSEHCRRNSGENHLLEFTRPPHAGQFLTYNWTCYQKGVTCWMCIT